MAMENGKASKSKNWAAVPQLGRAREGFRQPRELQVLGPVALHEKKLWFCAQGSWRQWAQENLHFP